MAPKRAVAIGVLLLIALSAWYLLSVVDAVRHAPMPISYWVMDDRTLGIQVMTGPGAECGIAATEEMTTQVRVRVECRLPLLSAGSSAVGVLHDFVLSLNAPLAGRAVLDGSGLPAKHCPASPC